MSAPAPLSMATAGKPLMTPTSSSANLGLNLNAGTAASSSAGAGAGTFAKPVAGVGLKTDAVAESQMRAAIRALVASADPDAILDVEAEDMLLTVASEFLESTTNFSARLARHRGSDTLDVKDLQLHLERHHHIRVPGFASTDDLGKVPAFAAAGQAAPGGATAASGITATGVGASGATAANGQSTAAAGSSTAAGTTAGSGTGAGKGKEKATAAAPTLRSKRLAAVKQSTTK